MSLRTVVDVALHFESFRNVDLFHQGLYHLKTRLYREEDGEQRLTAVPFAYSTCPLVAEKSKLPRMDHHNLIPAHIMDDTGTFSTRSFLIRYCEEEVELNDIGQFRIEVPIDSFVDASKSQVDLTTPLLLEIDLMFADLTQHGGADRFGEQPDVDSTEFKSVSTHILRLHSFGNGVHEFCPIVFDEFHFCVINMVVHTTLLDFRFRFNSAPAQARLKHSCTATNGVERNEPKAKTRQNSTLSFSEHIYGTKQKRSREEILILTEQFYRKYLGALAGAFIQLAVFFKQLCRTCLVPAQYEAFSDDIDLPAPLPFDQVPIRPQLLSGDSLNDYSIPGMLIEGEGSGQSLRAYLEAKLPAKGRPEHLEQEMTMLITCDLLAASSSIAKVWQKLLHIESYCCREASTMLRTTWETSIRQALSHYIIKKPLREDKAASEEPHMGDGVVQDKLAEELRAAQRSNSSRCSLAVEDQQVVSDIDDHPVVLDQRYQPLSSNGFGKHTQQVESENVLPSEPKCYRGVHLFVLVHGWQGNSFDMRLMKNNLALLFPDAIFMCSTANEDLTDGDMNDSGIRLAQEVTNYIQDWCPGSALGRLSFITFSQGGLVVRAALPLLHEYSSKMFTFLTFSCQHLGYKQETYGLVTWGLWRLVDWRKVDYLKQLTMTDAEDPRETFVYRLSKAKGLEYFRWVVFTSSHQDQFAPYDTARALKPGSWKNQAEAKVVEEMVRNIWEPVDENRVIRLDINFKIAENTVDNMIGRAAHIRFLECQPVMKLILHNYPFLFR
mmetsp:Transcript_37942/g.60092  ORF Transcript_37942/g.60092 Transcript_37942/m.60092 type:complete len:778 (-) Transcript_37942:131-2464(-)